MTDYCLGMDSVYTNSEFNIPKEAVYCASIYNTLAKTSTYNSLRITGTLYSTTTGTKIDLMNKLYS